jgi:hypothetical protein
MTKHISLEQFKSPVRPDPYAGRLPCRHAPLGGELLLNSDTGCFQAVAFVEGVSISLGVYCSANAACHAIADAHRAC